MRRKVTKIIEDRWHFMGQILYVKDCFHPNRDDGIYVNCDDFYKATQWLEVVSDVRINFKEEVRKRFENSPWETFFNELLRRKCCRVYQGLI